MERPYASKRLMGKHLNDKYNSWYHLDLDQSRGQSSHEIHMKCQKCVKRPWQPTRSNMVKVYKSVTVVQDNSSLEDLQRFYKCYLRDVFNILFIFITLFVILYSTAVYSIEALRADKNTKASMDNKF